MPISPELAFAILTWGTWMLGSLVAVLICAGTVVQWRKDRQNRHRIQRYQAWEQDLARFLFSPAGSSQPFPPVDSGDQMLFQTFLLRYHAALAGQEAEALRGLYFQLGVHDGLPERLRHRTAAVRAQAAHEVGAFQVGGMLPRVVPLLGDPVPYVALRAAQTLTRSRNLLYAGPVVNWVLREERYQRERLLRVLEGFGPDLMPWLVVNLPPPETGAEPWVLFSLLVAANRHRDSEPRILHLLEAPDIDLRVSALKALGALADPQAFPRVEPLLRDPAWPVRAQVAKTLGLIGGPRAVPSLMELIGDPVYEVRRNAAQGLADLGHAGTSALGWIAEDPQGDPFARDMAQERLEWVDERGHL
jgi:hypothetical protein